MTTKPDQDETFRGGTELLGENADPVGPDRDRPGRRLQPGGQRRRRVPGARRSAPWTIREFGGYTIAATTPRHRAAQQPAADGGHVAGQEPARRRHLQRREPGPDRPGLEVPARWPRAWSPTWPRPDIVAVEEVQDNDGATDDGVVAADQTINKLTDGDRRRRRPALRLARDRPGQRPGRRPAGRQHPRGVPVQPGPGDLRGSRRRARSTARPPARRWSRRKGEPDLTLSPGRIDPTNPVWTASRKPLVGEFTFQGKPVFVVANHFDAKLGDQNADGRFQFPAQSSATQRAGQASVEHDFVQRHPRHRPARPTWSSSATSTTTSSARR